MDVLLYKVGRNLNRAYRTCEAFGISSIKCFECKQNDINILGNLYKASNRVSVTETTELPDFNSTLILETCYETPIWEVEWEKINTIVIGGETSGINTKLFKSKYTASIPMMGKVSGLTVEAALSIALYERSSYLFSKKLINGEKIDEFEYRILDECGNPISRSELIFKTGFSETLMNVFIRNLLRMNKLKIVNRKYVRI